MRGGGGLWRAGFLGVGLGAAVLGCHGRGLPTESAATVPGELAAKGAAGITAVCSRQDYPTARVGLIAGETKLREDVFEMRDPSTYRVVPYRLEDTVRLEEMLRLGAGQTGRPSDQAKCMRDFADHLQTLSDPLVEAAKDQKEVDSMAFKDAEKEAQQEIEMQQQVTKSPRR